MKKITYAILAVPIVAALVAAFAFFPASFGSTAIAGLQQQAQVNNQALEQRNQVAEVEDETSAEVENESGAEVEDDDGAEVEDDDNAEVEDEIGAEDDAEVDEPGTASQTTISASQARDIAAKHLSVDPSAVQEVELEREGGQLVYSVELTKGDQEFEVEVDATTGEVVEVEQEDD
jgi:uncharacterized membrane protein YkoI